MQIKNMVAFLAAFIISVFSSTECLHLLVFSLILKLFFIIFIIQSTLALNVMESKQDFYSKAFFQPP